MKRRFTRMFAAVLIFLLGGRPSAFAQAACQHTSMPGYEMIWYEGFEEAGTPAGWQTLDLDGDGYNWAFMQHDDVLWGMTCLNMQCEGDGLAISASFINETMTELTPDNWLILPVQDIGKDYHLTFRVQAQDDDYANDCFGVYVSADVDHPLDTSSYVQLGGDYMTPVDYETIDIDLSAYEGERILIAIRHYNSYDQFVMDFDCFAMWGKEGYTGSAPVGALPRTGDDASLALWVCLLAAAGVGMIARRRREA